MNLKTIMPATALLLAFSVCTSNVKAADGDYVVTLKGDTIKCKISTPAFGWGKCKYKLEGSDESVKIEVKDIKSYYINKRQQLFRAVYHDGKENWIFFM